MTKELKPCPFCPDGVLPVRLKKDGKPTGIVAHACYALGREIRVPEHVWQTRYKRTCRNVDMVPKDVKGFYPTPHFECSECGASYALTDYAYWCPSCGAEVVDGD